MVPHLSDVAAWPAMRACRHVGSVRMPCQLGERFPQPTVAGAVHYSAYSRLQNCSAGDRLWKSIVRAHAFSPPILARRGTALRSRRGACIAQHVKTGPFDITSFHPVSETVLAISRSLVGFVARERYALVVGTCRQARDLTIDNREMHARSAK